MSAALHMFDNNYGLISFVVWFNLCYSLSYGWAHTHIDYVQEQLKLREWVEMNNEEPRQIEDKIDIRIR